MAVARTRVPRAVRERQMLAAAGRTFAERGYRAASMDDIAAAVGVTKPMLYAYFGSKRQLYLTYVEEAGRELRERMRGAATAGDEPEARLRAGIDAFFVFVAERRDGWAVLHRETSAQGGPLAAQVAGLRERIVRMAARMLRQLHSADGGSTRRGRDLEIGAHAFVGAGESLANWYAAHPDAPREQLVESLLRVARGDAAAPAPEPGI